MESNILMGNHLFLLVRTGFQKINRLIAPRFKIGFYPFVAILFFVVLGFSLFNVIFYIKPGNFISSPILQFIVIPMILAIIPVKLWLSPKLKRLIFVDQKPTVLFSRVELVAIALITMVNYFTQIYLEDSLGQVIYLKDIAEIQHQKPAKFYVVEHYIADNSQISRYFYMHKVRGRFENDTYYMDLYFVLPIFSKLTEYPIVWLGVHFKRETNVTLFVDKLDEHKRKFIAESIDTIKKTNLRQFDYLESIRDDSLIFDFYHAISKNKVTSSESPKVLLANYKSLSSRIVTDLSNVFVFFVIGLQVWFTVIALFVIGEE